MNEPLFVLGSSWELDNIQRDKDWEGQQGAVFQMDFYTASGFLQQPL